MYLLLCIIMYFYAFALMHVFLHIKLMHVLLSIYMFFYAFTLCMVFYALYHKAYNFIHVFLWIYINVFFKCISINACTFYKITHTFMH